MGYSTDFDGRYKINQYDKKLERACTRVLKRAAHTIYHLGIVQAVKNPFKSLPYKTKKGNGGVVSYEQT